MQGEKSVQQFAAFDFDGTLLKGYSTVKLVKSMLYTHSIPYKTVLAVCWWGIKYLLGFSCDQGEVRSQVFSIFDGRSTSEVDAMMEKLYKDWIQPYLFPDALAEMRSYQQRGIHVAIVSASFEPIVRRLSLDIGADVQISTSLEIRDGVYTGRVVGTPCEGQAKLDAFNEYANAFCHGCAWELVAAYGDHSSDEYLLRSANKAFAVNPDRALKKIAKLEGWKLIKWNLVRKNVTVGL